MIASRGNTLTKRNQKPMAQPKTKKTVLPDGTEVVELVKEVAPAPKQGDIK